MKSNPETYSSIQKLISSKKFNEALVSLESSKDKLSELDYWFLVSVSLRYSEEYSKALSALSEVVRIDPKYGRAFQEFGHIHYKLNNKDMALRSYIRAIQNNPSLQASWLGILSFEDADSKLLELANKNIFYLKNLPPELKSVLSFIHEGKYKKADDLCRFFLQSSPHNVEGMRLLAILGSKLHVYDESEFLLESCLVFEPDNKDIQIDYIDILIKRQKYGQALDYAKKLYKNFPDDISSLKTLAVTLQQTDKQQESLDLYRKILDIEPMNAEVFISKGHLHKNFGELDKSISSYKKAYQVNKYFGDAYWSLANLKTYNFSDKEIFSLGEMLADDYVNDDEKVFMHFALGKAYEDRENFEKSFHHYSSGNSMKLNYTKFDIDDLQNMTELFYDNAFQDDTLDKFLRSKDDPHGLRFAKWIYQKLTGSYVWDDDRAQRRQEHNVITVANNHMMVVHDRSSAHVAAWHSPKRPKNEVGRHFKLDECRVWMRLHFWALRESGLIERSPAFANYYVRFIAHFVRVYENSAPIFARDSFRWSSSQKNIQRYIDQDGRKMKDVLGLGLNASLSQLPLEEVNDSEWPYNRTRSCFKFENEMISF